MKRKMFFWLAAALLAAPFFYFLEGQKKYFGVDYSEILKSPGTDWLTYGGDYASRRYSPLKQINRRNIERLDLLWVYEVKNETSNLRVTPLVHDGAMYITNAHEIEALEAANGRRRWFWRADGYSETWMNRGAALLDEQVFFITNDCRLTALEKITGRLRWQKQYADPRNGYSCTTAPLALKDRVIAGVSGGDEGAPGFVAALAAEDGRELWRFSTVIREGTLKGGAATWLSGSFDSQLNLLYWSTGNPWPDFEGESRPGDNLYSNSVVALNPDNGQLRWHFQFTPHDLHDWDANEPLVLADLIWRGKPRKVLLQANRNGFFYVLDRTSGEFLLGKSFVKKMTWANGLDAKGRPLEAPEKNVGWLELKEKKWGVCPGLIGATNWMSSSFHPETELFYVVLLESCDLEPGKHFLRAIDPRSGNIRWEYAMSGLGRSAYPGVMSTAGGLVLAGDDASRFVALDAATGEWLWDFSLGYPVFSSPMTYEVNGRQYISIAAGPKIFTFGFRP